eukprot:9188387-Pyramimonas_sp.AAC.1
MCIRDRARSFQTQNGSFKRASGTSPPRRRGLDGAAGKTARPGKGARSREGAAGAPQMTGPR